MSIIGSGQVAMRSRFVDWVNRNRFEWAAFILLIAFFLVADIRANLPINDDWAYITTIGWLHDYGVLKFTNWQYMTLISQMGIAWPWTAAFGDSILALRVLTLAISFVGLVFLRKIIQLLTQDPFISAAVSLILYFNPIFLATAASFMTDIYFFTLSMGSIYFLYAALQRGDWRYTALAWALAAAALLQRQLAIAIPMGLGIALLLRGDNWRFVLLRAGVPLLAMALALVAYVQIVTNTIGLPANFDQPSRSIKHVLTDIAHLHPTALVPLLRGMALGCLYLGFWTMPLALAVLFRLRGKWDRAIAAAIGAVALAIAFLYGAPIPTPGNVLETWGLGPRLLAAMAPAPPGVFWWFVTGLACLSLGTLAVLTCRFFAADSWQGVWKRIREEWMVVGIASTAVLAYAPLVSIYGPWIDRYLLITAALLLSIFAAMAVRVLKPLDRRMVVALLCVWALASLALLHDSFAWRRAVATTIAAFERNGISSAELSGGFEHDNLVVQPDDPSQPLPPVTRRVELRRCVVGELAVSGWRVVSREPVERWLPLGTHEIVGSCRP